jgi:glycosyltransferase involved in cell wall biosynthesis
MKITVSVTNDLVTDQRVHKVCTTLLQEDFQINLVGRKLKNSKPLERKYNTTRFQLFFNKSFLFYAEYNIRLFFYLLFTKTDVFLSNDTDSLPANYLASRLRKKPLIFDAHEMFPEMPEVIDRKMVKWFWKKIEDWIFPNLKYSYTVCRSIADIYNRKYNINMHVVRNIPFSEHNITPSPAINANGKKILLYQGAVNMGRGIEWVIDTMPHLDGYVFYVVGGGDVLDELKMRVKKRRLEDRVLFTGKIPFEQLAAYTQSADIGINLLENKGLNYYYSLPNRIFDYIRNHIPVLSVDFPEIRKIVAHYDIGVLINHFEPEFLAETIRKMTANGKNEKGFATANAELSWENESLTLLRIVKDAVNKR